MTVKAEQPVVRVPVPAGLREAYLITRYDPRTVTIIAIIAIDCDDRDRPRHSSRQEQAEGPL